MNLDISARDFRALVTPVIPHTDGPRGFPVLQAIKLSVQGEHLLAIATDRYSLGICRHKLDGEVATFEAVVPVPAVKQILTVFRVTKTANPQLRLSVDVTTADALLTVTAIDGLVDLAGATLKYQLITTEFPKVEHIIAEGIEAKPEPFDVKAFNAEYLSRFRAATKVQEPVICRQTAPTKPMVVTVGQHFVGAVMPVRLTADGGTNYSADAFAAWEALLKPKPARKTTAKKTAATKAPAKKATAPRKRAIKKAVA